MKRYGFRGLLTAAVMTTGLLASTNAFAAVDMFLTADGIKGESLDKAHPGAIDVLAWSWGESTGAARTRRGLLPAACIQDLSLTKYLDSATPALIADGVMGHVIPNAVLEVRKAGSEGSVAYLKLTMKNVLVSAYQTGGSGGEDRLTENVTLHFEEMQGQYFAQRADGTIGNPTTWDITSGNIGCR